MLPNACSHLNRHWGAGGHQQLGAMEERVGKPAHVGKLATLKWPPHAPAATYNVGRNKRSNQRDGL